MKRLRLRNRWHYALAAAAVVIACASLGTLMLASISDWNRARPWLNRSISSALQRPFEIKGDLRLGWVRRVETLHWWIPRPQIMASDIVIGNPAWAKRKTLADIRDITFVLDPLPLFRHTVVLPLLDIDNADVALERRTDEKNNWTFGDDNEPPSRWRFAPGLLRLHNTKLQLDDAKYQLTLAAEADSYQQGVRWRVQGHVNNKPLKGHGSAGSLLALQDKTTPYPIEFFLESGSMQISASGTLTNPSQLAALDVKLKLSAFSMAQLYLLSGIALPETPPFSTEGHLRGSLDPRGAKWRYENFKGRVGNSDLGGDVLYESRAPRPLLTATLISQSLNFADLAPLIGADSNENKARRGVEVMQPEDKVLPVEPFKTDRWRSIDAHVQFDARNIIRPDALPIQDLHAIVTLNNGVLKFKPLNFGVAGGKLRSVISLDSGSKPLHADIQIEPSRLKLKALFPTIEAMQESQGEVNGSAALTGAGNSIAALLDSADGSVKLFVDRGTISKFILEAAGLNLANVIAEKLFGDHQVNMNCAAANFNVVQGTMRTDGFVVDTDAALIDIDGTVDLGEEKLALTLHPNAKQLRVLSLRSPLYVNGTFKKPHVSIDKTAVALRGGGALALGAMAWPAALLPLLQPGSGENQPASNPELPADNGCLQLLHRAKEKAVSVR
jgi:uncharacterized protein involved in outer membrane biogenesis